MTTRSISHLIIGFGKAGKTLAADLAKHGESVILVEQSAAMYGGTCINIGCIPSKLLLVEGEKSARLTDKSAAFQAAMQRREQLTSALRAANYNKLATIPGVEILTGTARFLSPNVVEVSTEDGACQIEAERIYINTGARPATLSLEGADDKRIYDSTGLLQLDSLPARLVIVGGGYISLEFACMYTAFGTEVTILEQGDTFLAREDRDVAEAMLAMLADRGVKVVLQAETKRFISEVGICVSRSIASRRITDCCARENRRRPFGPRSTAGINPSRSYQRSVSTERPERRAISAMPIQSVSWLFIPPL